MENTVIAVIGAGNIGSRHLQGLAYGMRPYEIHIVEPLEPATAVSKERMRDAIAVSGKDNMSCYWHHRIAELPEMIDVAIVATGAEHRSDIIRGLLHHATVRYLVLEKFLFQKVGDYAQIGDLLQSQNIPTFVNTPRRCWQGYQQFRLSIPEGTGFHLTASTTPRNGLATNAIHIVDLMGFLSRDQVNFALDSSRLRVSTNTRHVGRMELEGMLTGTSSRGDTFEMRTLDSDETETPIIITAGSKTYIIDESRQQLDFVVDGDVVETVDFPISLQSRLTGSVVDDILATGTCDLPSYSISSAHHLECLRAFLPAMGISFAEGAICNIT